MMARRIGYIRDRYPEKRNIIGRAAGENDYLRLDKWHDRLLLLLRGCDVLAGRVLHRQLPVRWNLQAAYKPVLRPKVDVIHTFNAVCDTDVPWVCTFETAVPRTGQTVRRDWLNGDVEADAFTRKTFSLIAKESCVAIIALSRSNRDIQLGMMAAYDIPERDIIAGKMYVLPPPQPVMITEEELSAKFAGVNDCIEFIFVSGLFFRKGGEQVLNTLSRLAPIAGHRFHLTIVSTLIYGDDVSRTTREDMLRCKQLIDSSSWITHYDRLDNSDVLELCRKAHVGLMPTMADTYGYAAIEMQSCGCTMVTTDIRAMSEINNEQCGYLVSLPKYPSTDAKYDTDEDFRLLLSALEAGIDDVLEKIVSCPEQLEAKARASVAKIAAEHLPEQYARRLSEIYNLAAEKSR